MSKPTDYFKYKDSELTCEGVPLLSIAEQYGTPAYVYSADAFLEPLQKLKNGLEGLNHLVCFAVKSNSNLSILKLLNDHGAGMDLVSGGELFRAQSAGVAAERIVFSGVGKTAEEIMQALLYQDKGILSFNAESLPEIELIQAIAQRLDRQARITLRFNPDINAKTHPYISTGLKRNKFGLEKNEILGFCKEFAKQPVGTVQTKWSNLKIQGVSIHIGSQILSLKPIRDAFEKTESLILEMNQILPEPLSVVDLGGGVGISYQNEKPIGLETYCKLIRDRFGKFSKFNNPLQIILEPGRALSGNSGVLLSKVLFRKTRRSKDFLVIDAAMNDLIRPALYQSYHQIVPLSQLKSASKKTDVVGPVCESADCFASDRPLPVKIKTGDYLAILSSGAYAFTMSSNYNTRPRPPEILVQNGASRLIRRRETFEDLIRNERLDCGV